MSITRIQAPPGKPDTPYILPFLCGENIEIPCSLSSTRLLVTGTETNNDFAVVGSGGTAGAPIGFHFHKEAHDVFLCMKGMVRVWARDKCRELYPGDFASVPPNVIHQYQIASPYTEFLGLIIPGGWEDFFRFIGEPYAGPVIPVIDDRSPFKTIIPLIMRAKEKFDMVPVREHQTGPPAMLDAATENKIPEGTEAYFLKDNTGPRWVLGGILCRPFITTKQSAGKFSIASIEGSGTHASGNLLSGLTFKDVKHCVQVVEGVVDVEVDGKTAALTSGETVYIPSRKKFSLHFTGRMARFIVFANGGGLEELVRTAGQEYKYCVLPPKELEEVSAESLRKYSEQFNFEI